MGRLCCGRSGVADENTLHHGAIHVAFLIAEMEITEQPVTALDAVAQRGGSIEPAADSDEGEMPEAACLHHERQRDPTLGMDGAAFRFSRSGRFSVDAWSHSFAVWSLRMKCLTRLCLRHFAVAYSATCCFTICV